MNAKHYGEDDFPSEDEIPEPPEEDEEDDE